jgi:hypothetical protein
MRFVQDATQFTSVLASAVVVTTPIPEQIEDPRKGCAESNGHDDTNRKKHAPALTSKLANVVTDRIDDHIHCVPCFFSKQQLLELRPKPEFSELISADSETLRSSVIGEAVNIGRSVFDGLIQTNLSVDIRPAQLLHSHTRQTVGMAPSLSGLR